MSNEIVKHHNDLNTVVMRTWTSEELNFFFAIISKARDKGGNRLYFDTDELKELSQFADRHKQRWEDTLKNCAKKITQLVYFEEKESKFRAMTLFSLFEVDLKNRTVSLELSEHYEYILNRLSANFTTYELSEFTQIRSTYAKTAYRLLKQWRFTGRREFKITDFKRFLDMPESYRPSEIDRLVLKPIKKELSPYFLGLKIKKVKSNKRGNPVIAYEFTWKPEERSGQPYVKDKFKSPKKGSKISNIPEWSNQNYQNKTSAEEKQELEKKKKEMLSRLEKSSFK